MVGITQNRSVQDEKLIEAIFQSHWAPESRAASNPVYGATATNLIIDARPTVNAVANSAKGAGTENMDHYKDSKKVYLGIDHIHTMRDSLSKVVEALRESETLLASISGSLPDQTTTLSLLDRGALRRSGWLRHIATILEGTAIIVKNVHINSSHVLIHCSDGWDRTAQLSAMSQICLDPFYRTIRGLEILIEKDWLSFGHKFLDRCGHLSSDKFFLSSSTAAEPGSGAEAAQAFFTSVQNRFASQGHIKETSPIFHQFLESIRQLQRQFPQRFQYNERFLRQLYYHLYSCQYGTFLFNCEKDRKVGDGLGPPPIERTVSVWDFFNTPEELALNTNPDYDPSLDDPKGHDMGVLIPNPKNVRFWNELYGRGDEEMNGRVQPPPGAPEVVGTAEGVEDDPVTDRSTTPSGPIPSSTSPAASAAPLAASQTMSLPLSSRSTSPGLERAMNTLSLSAPSLSGAPTTNSSGQEGPPSLSRPSPMRSHASSTSSASSSPLWSPPDILSSSAVKSLWGKISSNATTAISAAQNAYSGMAKDLINPAADASPDPASMSSELRSRENLKTWGDTNPSSSGTGDPSLSGFTIANPWATTSTSRLVGKPSLIDENPWGLPTPTSSQGPLSPRSSTRAADPLGTLPLDPAIPPSLRQNARSTRRTSPPPPDKSTVKSDDPLGVGHW